MATIYKWKPGTRLKVDAQAAGDELERIGQRTQLTPRAVLDSARKKSSPIHDAFTWDDTEAAQKCREEEARYLMRHLIVVSYKDQQVPATRAFLCPMQSDDSEDKGAWYPTIEAMERPDLRDAVIERAKTELSDFRRKYRHLQTFATVIDAINGVLGE